MRLNLERKKGEPSKAQQEFSFTLLQNELIEKEKESQD